MTYKPVLCTSAFCPFSISSDSSKEHYEILNFSLIIFQMFSGRISFKHLSECSKMNDVINDQIMTSSFVFLIAAMTLTVCIALFHGKCHLMHRREFMQGITLAHRDIINEARMHHYGWSFVLAWICVVLCFVHTWVWLVKAQQIPEKSVPVAGSRARRKRASEFSHDNSAMLVE